MSAIFYTLQPIHPEAHLFAVSCTVKNPQPEGQIFSLPAWNPGSYKIRDFTKQVSAVYAESNGKQIDCFKLDKQTWQCEPSEYPVTIHYQVYAWDLSVRGNHLDQTHATINGAGIFVSPMGVDENITLEIKRPEGAAYKTWKVATSMKRRKAEAYEFGEYEAKDYAELIDHPIELGHFTVTHFTEKNIPHEIVFCGLAPNTDIERITNDIHRVCAYYLQFFPKPVPMDRYVFIVQLLDQGFGGLEHRASSYLHFSKYGLPTAADKAIDENYLSFLTLCSHEYLHTWLVKGIKPAAFMPYDLSRENYTTQLWIFEGFTAYYEDLALVRSGLITEQQFLNILLQKITRLWRTPGRFSQSVLESSYDAWTKFYQPDENTPNITVSYYLKGSLIAFILDITLRSLTQGRESSDTLLLALWERYAENTEGVPETGLIDIIRERMGAVLDELLHECIYSTTELPLEEALQKIGIELAVRPAKTAMDKGEVSFKPIESVEAHIPVGLGVIWDPRQSALVIQNCLNGSCAQQAGLSAGDIVVAVDHLKVDCSSLSPHLGRYLPGDTVTVHAFRRDALMQFQVKLEAALPVPVLIVSEDTSPETARRKSWLGTLPL